MKIIHKKDYLEGMDFKSREKNVANRMFYFLNGREEKILDTKVQS